MVSEKKKAKSRKNYARNREKRLAQKKLYYEKERESILEKSKERYADNREEIRKKQNEHYAKHRAKPRGSSTFDKKAYQKDYYLRNKEHQIEQVKRNYQKNKEKIRERERKRYWDNRDFIRKQQAEWYQNNKEKRSAYNKEWRKNNPDKVRAGMRRFWEKNKNQVILRRVGCEIRRCIRSDKKATRYWERLVGYTLEDLMAHIEAQFKNGMSWGNHGEWHIDHIKPVSEFGADQIKECWSLDNLQPLWAEENVAKGVGS